MFPITGSLLIAPFWDDVDIRSFGNIYYRQTSNATLLRRARDQLQESLPSSGNFIPSILFIATWDTVPGFSAGSRVGFLLYVIFLCHRINPGTAPYNYHDLILLLQENTFQVVIAANGQETFVFFIYDDIQWGAGANIGFNAGDGTRSFMVPGALTNQTLTIEDGSNVDVTGLYIYRVDSCLVQSSVNG